MLEGMLIAHTMNPPFYSRYKAYFNFGRLTGKDGPHLLILVIYPTSKVHFGQLKMHSRSFNFYTQFTTVC